MGLTSEHPPKGGKKPKVERVNEKMVPSPNQLADGIGRVLQLIDVLIDKSIDTTDAIEATVSSEDPEAATAKRLFGAESVRLSAIVGAHLSCARQILQTAGEVALGHSHELAKRADKLKKKHRKDEDS